MDTYSFAPIIPLRRFIKNIWIVKNGHSSRIEQMIPFGCMDLIYVAHKNVSYQGKEEIQFHRNDLFLTGQVTQPYHLTYAPNAQIIGFGFYPHTAHLFIRDSVFQFTDKICHLASLFSYPEILDTLHEQTDIEVKIFLLQQFILNRISKKNQADNKHNYVSYLLKYMYEKKGHFDISKAQSDLNISPRYIQLLFKEQVGTNPLLYAKIIRFLNALDIYQKKKIPLIKLAHDLGYYDQAHFIRDFKRFTGLSPKKYFNTLPYLMKLF